jgi:hypothetical protein
MNEKNALLHEHLQLRISSLQRLVEAKGFAVQSVPTTPGYAHSVGMAQSQFGADVLIAGNQPQHIAWLERFAEAACYGLVDAMEGRSYAGLFSGVDVYLRRLHQEQVIRLMRMSVIVSGPVVARGWILHIPSLGLTQSTELIMSERLLHSPMMDERNVVRPH